MIPGDVKELLERATPDHLASLVLDTARSMAEEINRLGIIHQLGFLREAGVSWKYFREALSGLATTNDTSKGETS